MVEFVTLPDILNGAASFVICLSLMGIAYGVNELVDEVRKLGEKNQKTLESLSSSLSRLPPRHTP